MKIGAQPEPLELTYRENGYTVTVRIEPNPQRDSVRSSLYEALGVLMGALHATTD